MTTKGSDIENLDCNDSAILNREGWFLLTYYQTRDKPTGSRAHKLAIDKAMSIDRKAGLRIHKKVNIQFLKFGNTGKSLNPYKSFVT